MGRVASSLFKRPVLNWNVENRAQRLLEKQEKPKVAPRHPSSEKFIEDFRKDHPEILEEQAKKDKELEKMLEGLVVNPEKFGQISSKKKSLPEDRSLVPDYEFGYLEPEVIRPGRCTIKQAMQFLGNHFSDPDNFTDGVIAKEYNLNKDQVKRVLHYFSVFLIQIPGQQTSPQTLSEVNTLNPSFLGKKLGSGSKDSVQNKDSQTTVDSSSETK